MLLYIYMSYIVDAGCRFVQKGRSCAHQVKSGTKIKVALPLGVRPDVPLSCMVSALTAYNRAGPKVMLHESRLGCSQMLMRHILGHRLPLIYGMKSVYYAY